MPGAPYEYGVPRSSQPLACEREPGMTEHQRRHSARICLMEISQAALPGLIELSAADSAFMVGESRESAEPRRGYSAHKQRSENALDALLDELQTFSRPSSQLSQVSNVSTQQPIHLVQHGNSVNSVKSPSFEGSLTPKIVEIGRKGSVDSSCVSLLPSSQVGTLRRLHSYPSSSDTDTSPPIGLKLTLEDDQTVLLKPPVPERNIELFQLVNARRVPPPPPPRTSSRSPLISPISPQLPPRNLYAPITANLRRGDRKYTPSSFVEIFSESCHKSSTMSQHSSRELLGSSNNMLSVSNSSSCESINSQEGLKSKKQRQGQLELRHQELLRKQKALQEQYTRLQHLQRNAYGCTNDTLSTPPDLLKKTGSESNLLMKMGLDLSTNIFSSSLTSLVNSKRSQMDIIDSSSPKDSTISGDSNNTIINTMENESKNSSEVENAVTKAGTTTQLTISTTTSVMTTSKLYEPDIL